MASNLSRKVKLGGMAEGLQELRKPITYCLLKMACRGCFGESERASGSGSHGVFRVYAGMMMSSCRRRFQLTAAASRRLFSMRHLTRDVSFAPVEQLASRLCSTSRLQF
jgi:hypothetical protein